MARRREGKVGLGSILLHVILTLVTGGLWLIVLVVIALLKHNKR